MKDGSLQLRIAAERWFEYFAAEYGVALRASLLSDPAAAVAKLGNARSVAAARCSSLSLSTATSQPATPLSGQRRASVSCSSRTAGTAADEAASPARRSPSPGVLDVDADDEPVQLEPADGEEPSEADEPQDDAPYEPEEETPAKLWQWSAQAQQSAAHSRQDSSCFSLHCLTLPLGLALLAAQVLVLGDDAPSACSSCG